MPAKLAVVPAVPVSRAAVSAPVSVMAPAAASEAVVAKARVPVMPMEPADRVAELATTEPGKASAKAPVWTVTAPPLVTGPAMARSAALTKVRLVVAPKAPSVAMALVPVKLAVGAGAAGEQGGVQHAGLGDGAGGGQRSGGGDG